MTPSTAAASTLFRPYVIDTNVVLAYARHGALSRNIEAIYGLVAAPLLTTLSIVTEGEIRVIAARQGWGAARRRHLTLLLSAFTRVNLDTPGVLDAYVSIDVYSGSVGRTMGKNDLWIAATASATGAILLTTDKDFDHLDGVFLSRIWIDPA